MASGDTLYIWGPYSNEPPAANAMTLDTRNATNPRPCLDADAATNESAIFSGVMPQHYSNATGVNVLIHWAASTDTTDTHHCYWDACFERVTGLDMDGDSFEAVNSVDTDHCNATSGIETVTTIPFDDGADMDSVVAGDHFRLMLTRDAANDDMTGDSEIFQVELRER